MKNNQKKFKKSFFAAFALILIFAFGVTIAAADTSVAWTKDIGDVTAADISEDGSVIYAAVGSQVFVYDSAGVQQNTFTVGGTVVKLVCTADGTRAALYTDGEEVYYIDNGALTWTQSFTMITDIDISNAGSVLVVESGVFHKILSDGTLEYNSSSGTYTLGVIDPDDEFAIVQSGTTGLQKYLLTTTDQYWGKIGDNTFNINFSDFQNLLVLNTDQTSAIVLNKSLGNDLWDEIFTNLDSANQYYGITDESLILTNSDKYSVVGGGDIWYQKTSSASWGPRADAAAWVYDGRMYIAGGRDGSTYYNDVWWSEDGSNWTQATSSAEWSARYQAMSWVYDGRMYIAGGRDGSTYYNDVWWSEDGSNWTQATSSAGWSARAGGVIWVYDNAVWLGGGNTNKDVWKTTDCVNWVRVSTSSSCFHGYYQFGWVYNDRIWIAGGFASPPAYRDVWWSQDGVSWTQATSSAGWSGRCAAITWVYGDYMWVGGGYTDGTATSSLKDVWWSQDGVSWTQATTTPWGNLPRSSGMSWVYNDTVYVGGGGSMYRGGLNTFYKDVWEASQLRLEIQPSSTGQTFVFYNYTGSNPQHTQTTYNNAEVFQGTTELRTKPTLAIYNLQTTKTLNGNIQAISLSDRGDWIGTATTTRIYHDQITAGGFGTEYYAALGSTGTIYDIATANSAAMSVVGQGLITDIYSMSASRVGTYTAGGAVTHVDIADKNALWAASGGEDGKVYVFSKDASSNWYLEYSSDSENPITALRMSARGEYILAGRTNSLTLYQTNTSEVVQTDFWFTLYAYKDSDSYRNAAVNVSVYQGNQWNSFAQGLTDSAGKYVVQLTAGQNYKFEIGNGEKILIYMASPSVTSQTVSIYSSPISTSIEYNAVWDSSTNSIKFNYTDTSAQTEAVTVKIVRTDNWNTVYDQTFNNQQTIQQSLPIIDDTTSYKVEFSVRRVSGVTRNTFIVSSSRDIIPIPLDQNIKNILFCGMLFVIAGLFSYLSAFRGPIVVSLVAGFFIYIGWVTIPWEWFVITIAVAIVASMSQRRS